MPFTKKGKEIMSAMGKEYGDKKGKEIFYASRNKGTIKGVEKAKSKALKNNMKAKSKALKMEKETTGEMKMMCEKCGYKHKKGEHKEK